MQNGGITAFAWVFMVVSMGAVTTLMVWCFYRILRAPGTARAEAGERGGGGG